MSLSFEVSVVRDIHSQLNPMLQVLDACNTAGVSYPPEVTDFFGDALDQYGTDAAQLRAALENVQIQVAGDPLSDEGATIRLDDLPEGTKAIRIMARHEGNGRVEATPVPVEDVVEPEVAEPEDYFEDDLVEPEPEPEPVVAYEPEPAPVAVPAPTIDDTVEFDEPVAEFHDDSVLAAPPVESYEAEQDELLAFSDLEDPPTAISEPYPDLEAYEEPVAETLEVDAFEEPAVAAIQDEFPPIQEEPMAIEIDDDMDVLDIDEPLDLDSPTAISHEAPQAIPTAFQPPPVDDMMTIEEEPLDLELDELVESAEPVQPAQDHFSQLDLIRQQESQIMDPNEDLVLAIEDDQQQESQPLVRNDDLVLAVEDDLLDIDDLDDPLELDEPAEQM